jgi:hypothetical protein
MRKTLVVSLFVLATLTWSLAQNPGAAAPSGGQQQPSTSPQAPDASQQTPPSGSAGQTPSQPGAQPQQQMPNAPITEGCLAGSGSNYTITDKAGTTYKLNFPTTANLAQLPSHVGESVKVMGDITDAGKAGQSSINVSRIGRGEGTCPATGSSAPGGSAAPTPAPKP